MKHADKTELAIILNPRGGGGYASFTIEIFLLFCHCSDVFLHELHSDTVYNEEKKHLFQTTTVNLTPETICELKEKTSNTRKTLASNSFVTFIDLTNNSASQYHKLTGKRGHYKAIPCTQITNMTRQSRHN